MLTLRGCWGECLCALTNASLLPIVCGTTVQTSLTFRARNLSGGLWVGILKPGVVDMGSRPFLPQGETGIWLFRSNCRALCHRWGFSKSVSQPFYSFRHRHYLGPSFCKRCLTSGGFFRVALLSCPFGVHWRQESRSLQCRIFKNSLHPF